MDNSEYSVQPSRILMHDPAHGNSLALLGEDHLTHVNFFSLPSRELLHAEYRAFTSTIGKSIEVVYLKDLLEDDEDFIREADENPNLMFVRDSSITIPWMPQIYIPSRLALPTRAREPVLVGKAMQKLGLEPRVVFENDEYIEGGDILPVEHGGSERFLSVLACARRKLRR